MSLPSRYELGPRIGQGGTADVFRARSTEAHGFARTVVIKRIRGDLESSPEIAAMFAAEAEIVRRLQHGGIAQLLDFGSDDAAPYLVFEHVDGVSLDALRAHLRASGGDLTIADALCVVEQVADALAYSHRLREDDGVPLGLVHRDVTPRNILVSCEGLVKLTDFGLARVGRPLTGQLRTAPGVVKGTFGYMSPEQARGAPLDGRSDQFSLGVVLYEILTGDNPLCVAETLAHALRLLGQPLPRLPIGGAIDAALAAIVTRATSIDPRKRYPTIAELGAALQQWRGERGLRPSPEALATAVRRARGEDAIAEVRRIDEAIELPARDRERVGATVVAGRARGAGRSRAAVIGAMGVGVAVIVGGVAIWMASGHAAATVVGADAAVAIAAVPAPAPIVPAPPIAPAPPPPIAPAPPPVEVAVVPPPPALHAAKRAAPTADGRLKINVLPWADVQLDGHGVGHTPVDVAVAPGAHTIVLVNPDLGRRKEHHIEIHSNRLAEIKTW